MKYKAIFFDLDGTLLDTLDDLTAAVNHALVAYGYPPHTCAAVRAFIGDGVSALVHRALPPATSVEREAAVLALFRSYYASHNREMTAPYDGILPLLTHLRERGVRLGVVSNKFDSAVRELCDFFFPALIDVAVGESPAVRRKPAPDSLLAAAAQLGVSPAESVYIGDSDVDILTARAANMPCISVLWGFRDRDALLAAGAETTVASPAALLGQL